MQPRQRRFARCGRPALNQPKDYYENDEDLAPVDFAGIAEFRTDGVGAGTPEFRKQLEAYFRTIQVATRLALAVLDFSRSELAESAKNLATLDECDDGAMVVARNLHRGFNDLVRLAQYVRAAEVRQICAIALRDDMEADGDEEQTTAPEPPLSA